MKRNNFRKGNDGKDDHESHPKKRFFNKKKYSRPFRERFEGNKVKFTGLDRITKAIDKQQNEKGHKWNGENKSVDEVLTTLIMQSVGDVRNVTLTKSYLAYQHALDKIAPAFHLDGMNGKFKPARAVYKEIDKMSQEQQTEIRAWLEAADCALEHLAKFCTVTREYNTARREIPDGMEIASQKLNYVVMNIHKQCFTEDRIDKAEAAFKKSYQQNEESPKEFYQRLESTFFYLKNAGCKYRRIELRNRFQEGLQAAPTRARPQDEENFREWLTKINEDWKRRKGIKPRSSKSYLHSRDFKRKSGYFKKKEKSGAQNVHHVLGKETSKQKDSLEESDALLDSGEE
jgi:hypothetical protein